ncbi:MAG: hypothetical protein WA913_05280, partial [Pricia sp.]
GELENKGIEFSTNIKLFRKSDTGFDWSLFGNFAYNKNEVTELPGDGIVEGFFTAIAEGERLGAYYLTPWLGVNPGNGSPLYLDIDGNVTDVYSPADRRFSDKGRDPLYTGGFGTRASYGNFSLNVLFSYAFEQYRYNRTLALIEDPGFSQLFNQSTNILTEWQQPGDITSIPSPSFSYGFDTQSTRYLEDASFVRLRNIKLAFNFPSDMLKRNNFMKDASIYLQGQNLLTFTKWQGYDPEGSVASGYFGYPTGRTMTVGLDITF